MNLTSFILSAAILLQSVWTEKANADWKHPLLGKGLHCKCVMEKPVKKGLG